MCDGHQQSGEGAGAAEDATSELQHGAGLSEGREAAAGAWVEEEEEEDAAAQGHGAQGEGGEAEDGDERGAVLSLDEVPYDRDVKVRKGGGGAGGREGRVEGGGGPALADDRPACLLPYLPVVGRGSGSTSRARRGLGPP